MILKKRLGEMLIESKLLTEDQLKQILAEYKSTGLKLGQYITRQGMLDENQIIDVLSRQLKIDKYHPDKYPLEINLAQLIPIEMAEKFQVAPLKKKGRLLTLAIIDPLDISAIDATEKTTNCEVDPVICTEQEINGLIKALYMTQSEDEGQKQNDVNLLQTNPDCFKEAQDNMKNAVTGKIGEERDGSMFLSAKLVGRVKRAGSSCIEDENKTRYEISVDNNDLKRAEYEPVYCDVRIKTKNQAAVYEKDHYFIHKKNLYCNVSVLDRNERVALCELMRQERESEQEKNRQEKAEKPWLYPDLDLKLLPNYPEGFTEIQHNIKNTDKDIGQMSGLEFEKLISALLIKIGFDVTMTKQTADGGVDIIAYNNQPLIEGTYIVQCKRWGSSIGEPIVRDLYGVVTAERASKGILITNSTYTNSAISFAQGKPIELIDGQKLINLLEKYDLLPKEYILDGIDSSSIDYDYEGNDLREELSTLLNIIRKDPTNLRLRIKLAYKQIDSVRYVSKDFKLKIIRDAEDNLSYLSNLNYNTNAKVFNFIRHMSFHQLGYLKVVQGRIAEGIQYYLKAIEINSFSKVSIKDPYYDDPGKIVDVSFIEFLYKRRGLQGVFMDKYWWPLNLNQFFVINIINIITLSNYLGARQLAQKMFSKYKHRVSNYIKELCNTEAIAIDINFNFLREDWMHRAFYVLNYDEKKSDLEDILSESGRNHDYDSYSVEGNYFPEDLAHVFNKFNKYGGIFSISEEGKIYQRNIVEAIT